MGRHILSGVVADKVALPQATAPHQPFMDAMQVQSRGARSRTAEQERGYRWGEGRKVRRRDGGRNMIKVQCVGCVCVCVKREKDYDSHLWLTPVGYPEEVEAGVSQVSGQLGL